MIDRKINVNVTPTPDELAQEFSNMDEEGMAMFFNALAEVTGKWEAPFCFQLQALTDCEHLSDNGRYIMSQIGEYSAKTK